MSLVLLRTMLQVLLVLSCMLSEGQMRGLSDLQGEGAKAVAAAEKLEQRCGLLNSA